MSLASRFEAKSSPCPNTGCWLWFGSVSNRGYGYTGLGGKYGKHVYAHRLSWTLHRGPIPPGACVLHNCPSGDNPLCVNPDHLFIGTLAENQHDMAAKGRAARGAKNAGAKLTAAQVSDVRARVAGGATHTTVAAAFGVKRQTVGDIINGRRWAWLAC